MAKYKDLANAIIEGNDTRSIEITKNLINEGINVIDILNEGLFPGMEIVGKKFKADEIYLPEVLVAARAMRLSMEVMKPLLTKAKIKSKGIVILGTVKGDIHNIGKDIVGMMLEGGGFIVIDLGVDVAPEKFVEQVKKSNANILALSTLLTTTVPSMRQTIEFIRNNEKTRNIKIMVGGVPLNQEYADSMGADGYAPNAGGAVDLALCLLEK
jgi:5-methyltetrahydrofolate--homocysteine methyltransferase